jgi:hypothetical protein
MHGLVREQGLAGTSAKFNLDFSLIYIGAEGYATVKRKKQLMEGPLKDANLLTILIPKCDRF